MIKWIKRTSLSVFSSEKQSNAASPAEEGALKKANGKNVVAQHLVVGMDMDALGSYAISFYGLDLMFQNNSRFKVSFPDLKLSKREPVESLSVFYWGNSGLYLAVDNLKLYRSPAVPFPKECWSRETHKLFSPLFREIVLTCLIVLRKLGLSNDLAALPLTFLSDFASLAHGSLTGISFAVEPTSDYPSHALILRAGNQEFDLFTAKFGFASKAYLQPLNAFASRSLSIDRPEVIRSDT